jgi:hypothetical protein
MDIKVKVTFTDYTNVVKAKILYINGWYDLMNKCLSNQINENQLLKVEKHLEADDINTIDTTKTN